MMTSSKGQPQLETDNTMPQTQLLIRPKRRPLRKLRAAWRDTRALIREFNQPILAFIVVTILGGYIYGELYYHARGVFIDYIDRPYIMIQLMIIEPPEMPPSEWYLVAWWYALPPILIFIVGNGVADFVRLFFNRDERRDAWREAVASTYRHHMIVVGAGHVGLSVIRVLVQMGVDVIAIDMQPDPGVEDLLASLDVPLIKADGRLSSTLNTARLDHADALLVCSGNDYANMDVIMHARELNPNVRIVSRVWESRFAAQLKQFMNVQTVLSSASISAPAFAGSGLGIEITQTLRIGHMDYSMLRLTVAEKSFMDGRNVRDLQNENEMDIVLHGCGEDVEVKPDGDIVVRAGDTLVIFAQHDRILEVVSRNRKASNRRR